MKNTLARTQGCGAGKPGSLKKCQIFNWSPRSADVFQPNVAKTLLT